MNIEDTLKAAGEIMARWKPGAFVWHRASGKRGVIDGWLICGDGAVLVRVSWGDNQTPNFIFELSAVPIPEGTEGEEWRLAEHEEPGDDPKE